MRLPAEVMVHLTRHVGEEETAIAGAGDERKSFRRYA